MTVPARIRLRSSAQGYAQRRFGSTDGAVGGPFSLNNVPFTVVGVVPARFSGVDPAVAPNVYLPLRANLVLNDKSPEDYLNHNYYWLDMMARLRPGVSRRRRRRRSPVPSRSGWKALPANGSARTCRSFASRSGRRRAQHPAA